MRVDDESLAGHSRKKREVSSITKGKVYLKRFFWRATASLIWLHVIAHWYSHKGRLFYFERQFFISLESGLAASSFTPSNPHYFAIFLKLAWLSLLSGFSVIEALWYVTLYVPFFPFSMGFILWRGNAWRKEMEQKKMVGGLARPAPRHTYTLRLIALMLAWLLLYGRSHERIPQLVGIVIVGALLLDRASSAFAFAGSIETAKSGILDALILLNQQTNAAELIDETKVTPRAILKLKLFCFRSWYWFLRFLYGITRGKKGRNRAALVILIQYVYALLLLGLVAIFFWSLIIRFNVNSSGFGISVAFLASAGRVFPGLSSPAGLKIPLWIDLGSSMTAWLLFVVYAGPAASVFPTVQAAYIKLIADSYAIIRSGAVKAMLRIRSIKKCLDIPICPTDSDDSSRPSPSTSSPSVASTDSPT